MSAKKRTGGRVTPKGTQPNGSTKSTGSGHTWPTGHGGPDRSGFTPARPSGPAGPSRSGRRGNR